MRTFVLAVGLAVVATAPVMPGASPQTPGYDDTPFLPGGVWRVHDAKRPQPPVVTPGALVPAPPPADAVALFDGTGLAGWRSAASNGPARWRVEDGALVVVAQTGDLVSVEHFGDVQLHVEWAAPAVVEGEGQGRGNSGIFLMERYEIQVLDSFRNPTYADGQAAAIYGQYPPLVNAARPPGEWQSFDIVFVAPRFTAGALVSPARATVFHNGVLVHHDAEIIGATAHRAVARYTAHPPQGAIKLQDHGNPVRFRNIWARRLN